MCSRFVKIIKRLGNRQGLLRVTARHTSRIGNFSNPSGSGQARSGQVRRVPNLAGHPGSTRPARSDLTCQILWKNRVKSIRGRGEEGGVKYNEFMPGTWVLSSSQELVSMLERNKSLNIFQGFPVSNHSSRVGSCQDDPARPVILESLLT